MRRGEERFSAEEQELERRQSGNVEVWVGGKGGQLDVVARCEKSETEN